MFETIVTPTPSTRAAIAAGFLAALGCVASCVRPATAVLVVIDTDIAPSRTLALAATLRNGSATDATPPARVWVRGAPDGDAGTAALDARPGDASRGGVIAFPVSFGLQPRLDQPRDAVVTLVLDARVEAAGAEPARRIRRLARFAFVPYQTTRLDIFLRDACGEPEPGCTDPDPAQCTRAARCEVRGLTCGDDAQCVAPFVPLRPADAAVVRPDVPTREVAVPPAPDAAPDAAPDGPPPCVPPQVRCSGACVDVGTSVTNCGACALACAPPAGGMATCTRGTCGAACPMGLTLCGGRCVNIATDLAHCGACGRACAAGPGATGASCVAGACVQACMRGRGDCNNASADGCETPLNTNANCNACNRTCAGARTCQVQSLSAGPAAGVYAACCVDTTGSWPSCGGTCTAGQFCGETPGFMPLCCLP